MIFVILLTISLIFLFVLLKKNFEVQEAIIFGNRYRELQEHGLDPLRLIKPKGGDPVAPPVNKIEALKSGSMHCAGCGAHLESDLNFCPACGQEK